jgi:hypothetical protein
VKNFEVFSSLFANFELEVFSPKGGKTFPYGKIEESESSSSEFKMITK